METSQSSYLPPLVKKCQYWSGSTRCGMMIPHTIFPSLLTESCVVQPLLRKQCCMIASIFFLYFYSRNMNEDLETRSMSFSNIYHGILGKNVNLVMIPENVTTSPVISIMSWTVSCLLCLRYICNHKSGVYSKARIFVYFLTLCLN